MKKRLFCLMKWGITLQLLVWMILPAASLFATDTIVSTFAELDSAIQAVSSEAVIKIDSDIIVEKMLDIPEHKKITLMSKEGTTHTLCRSESYGSIFLWVSENAELILTNISLDGTETGSTTTNNPLIVSEGTLTLKTGAILLENHIHVPRYSGGGAIHNSGTLFMEDGATIQNCSHGYGSKAVANEGIFYMRGGTINEQDQDGYASVLQACYGAAEPQFIMSGGTITGTHDSDGDGTGGGVYQDGVHAITKISGDACISPVTLYIPKEEDCVQVVGKLNKTITVHIPRSLKSGVTIAKGADGYTLTEDDRKKFSLNRGKLKLDSTKNTLVFDIPAPVITAMSIDKDTVPYTGENREVTITGTNLEDGLKVTAFDGTMLTSIEAETFGKGTSSVATLVFPETSLRTPTVYTIKVSADDGQTYQAIEKTITQDAKPISANADHNSFTIKPTQLDTKTTLQIEAIGDRQQTTETMKGDERYIPLVCNPGNVNFTYKNNAYQTQLLPLSKGAHDIKVTYALERYDGTKWNTTSTRDTKTKTIQVIGAATVTDMTSDPGALPYTGGEVKLTINGTDLNNGALLVKAIDDDTLAAIQASASGTDTVATATLTFPTNTTRAMKSYTIKVSADNGSTWINKEIVMTIDAKPISANADHNTFTIQPTQLDTSTTLHIEAIGDRQQATDTVKGDEQYVPLVCDPGNIDFTYKDNTYQVQLTPLSKGAHDIKVTYALKRYDGEEWQDSGIRDTKIKTIQINEKTQLVTTHPSTKAEKDTRPAGGVKTGDESHRFLFYMMLIGSVSVLFHIIVIRRKHALIND